ncbi:MmpS family transport accessory protein [Flavobacterium sp. H122]|uniref:MmpS family transport accessory protein n=1 Tax=Flavobacterium sp. H122 TaxID=2529860 RepID=UPI0010A99E5E|nr:MmpS family transport accessory protein [Flavobacterium sp. H122]
MKKIIYFFMTILLLVSCDSGSEESNLSRDVRYEVSGTFDGSIGISYTTQSGGVVNGNISSLPWNLSITYDSTVTSASFAAAGNSGTSGKTLTIKVFRGDTLISTTNATAGPEGSFTMSVPTIVF